MQTDPVYYLTPFFLGTLAIIVRASSHGLLPFQKQGFNRWLEMYAGKIPAAILQVLHSVQTITVQLYHHFMT